MKRTQLSLLSAMVMMFLLYSFLDIYAWPLSKFAENVMQSMFAIILVLIDPKSLLNSFTGNPPEKEIQPGRTESNTTDHGD